MLVFTLLTTVIMSSNFGSNLPITVIERVLSCIPTHNWIVWEDGKACILPVMVTFVTFVDGLLSYAVFNPSLLLAHYYTSFDSKWSLEEVSKARMKPSLLEEASLTHSIKLHVSTYRSSGFHPLTILPHPHQLKSLELNYSHTACPLSMDEFIDSFRSLAPACTELKIQAPSTASSDRRID